MRIEMSQPSSALDSSQTAACMESARVIRLSAGGKQVAPVTTIGGPAAGQATAGKATNRIQPDTRLYL